MATFYPSSSNPRDAMANLYLRGPAGHLLYPESAVSGNMVYFNYSSSSPYSETLVGNVQPRSSCIGYSDLAASHLGVNSYSSWKDGKNETLFMQAHGESMDGGDELFQHSVVDESQIGLEAQLGILSGHDLSLHQSNMSIGRGQGLSLSLGMRVPIPSFKYQPVSSDVSALSSHQSNPVKDENYRDVNPKSRILNASASTYELTNIMSIIPNSKYLKAAQQLLDEIVNVQNALKQKTDNKGAFKNDGNHSNHQESSANSAIEISTVEKQELQNKMTKLFPMLDELDQRYKQYYNEMQIIVSSLDAIAGSNAAKPYTALALQTISRHFRCLRDAIDSQIRSAQKILREQDVSIGKGCGISRLRYIDKHIRKQKAIQQLSAMSQQAWRPQRGLPENSVSILRAWLFEHFLNPYPNDSEKLMLARQTGLNRSQISNWFINARVRLWKPMVEDMYKEEFMDSNSSSENATKDEEGQQSPSIEKYQTNQSSQPNITAQELTNMRSNQSSNINLFRSPINPTEGSSRLMAYPMAELGRHNNG